jgi:hypothetical protein
MKVAGGWSGCNNRSVSEPRKSIFRSLGEFFGHIRHGLRTDLKTRAVVRQQTEERREGSVVLRRTVIEEVEFNPERTDDESGPAPPPPAR